MATRAGTSRTVGVTGASSSSTVQVKDPSEYLGLYRAALKGDWNTARDLIKDDPSGKTAVVAVHNATALHVAAAEGHWLFVEELIKELEPESLEVMTDMSGRTALHCSANTKTARVLVNRNPKLTQIKCTSFEVVPLMYAAMAASPSNEQKSMVQYLSEVTTDDHSYPFSGDTAGALIMSAGFYDIALALIERYPNLALDHSVGAFALAAIAGIPEASLNGSQLPFWQRCIYSFVMVDHLHAKRGDMENPPQSLTCRSIGPTIPGVERVCNMKLMHKQYLSLVKCIFTKLAQANPLEVSMVLRMTHIARIAILNESVEFIKECALMDPDMLWHPVEGKSHLGFAIDKRCENVYNMLVSGNKSRMHAWTCRKDSSANTILHFAAKLAPPHKLISISGAALKMQPELQWFKEVESITPDTTKPSTNNDEKTARVLFTEEHADLLEKGEKWMKDTATSCMLVATLIATVVFAAPFTVPGGSISDINSKDNGIPIFLRKNSFMVFAIADSLALFSSLTSVLMFLSILTSRFSEEDFLTSLPRKLIIGLVTLFLSIAAMMVSFSAVLSIVLGRRFAWFPIAVTLVACVPVALFAMLQFPLLVQMIISTYGASIFRRHDSLKIW
ncbi:hypothetical protein MKW98_029355 [Papaver atlanticum]|uniref:PGG domain-containing protein n=1 Tax=Papaver atlanticum TaxID=357466 RepID=A0AAD4SIX8_9MAGN|nr:hypothetical protein MKW98_029355 [Papaver atlanticum]